MKEDTVMASRFKRQLYTIQEIKRIDGRLQYMENEDGTLFAGPYKTKNKPTDLSEWYIYGRFYKRFGYLSTKGISDLLYLPNKVFNHFLRDDMLLVSYGGKIVDPSPDAPLRGKIDRLIGYDKIIWGMEIVDVLRGARQYSNMDIEPFINEIKQKKDWLVATYPEEFGPSRWKHSVDEMFSGPFQKFHHCSKCNGTLGIMYVGKRHEEFDVIAHCHRCDHDWDLEIDSQGELMKICQRFWG